MKAKLVGYILLLTLLIIGCVEIFDYNNASLDDFLVVEGYITDVPGKSLISLSKSGDFNDVSYPKIQSAHIEVVEDENTIYQFVSVGNGNYIPADSLFYAKSNLTYQLSIILPSGDKYISDLATLASGATIDSVKFKPSNIIQSDENTYIPSIDFSIYTGSEVSEPQYYRYEFEETWLIVAPFATNEFFTPIYLENMFGTIVDVEWQIEKSDQQMNFCWGENTNRKLSLNSTEGTINNKLTDVTILSVPASGKQEYKYSLLVKQFALNADTYKFLSLLKEFSESNGFLFDVQPGAVNGNIHCVNDPDKKVIGIFYASQMLEKRIFVYNRELSADLRKAIELQSSNCEVIRHEIPANGSKTFAIEFMRDSIIAALNVIVVAVSDPNPPYESNIQVLLTKKRCADCRIGGKGNIQPDYWGKLY